MAKPTKTGDGDFLSRWSRRKRGEAVDESETQAPEAQARDTESDEATATDAETEGRGDPEVVAKLPDIDAMDDSSDFSVFMQKGVPEALRRRALRKLWGVNPILANLDGLNDYDEDYTQLHTLGRGMKTLYRIGKGYLSEPADAPESGETETAQVAARPDDSAAVSDALAAEPHDQPSARREEKVETASSDGAKPAESGGKPRGHARGRRWGPADEPDSTA